MLATDFHGLARRYTTVALAAAWFVTVLRRRESPRQRDERVAFAFRTVRIVGGLFLVLGFLVLGAFAIVIGAVRLVL